MATTASSFLSPAKFALQSRSPQAKTARSVRFLPARAQQQVKEAEANVPPPLQEEEQPTAARKGDAQSLPRQPLATSKNMSREYGGQWLSSTTRHIRIFAAYIDPETHAFDQTQMDKLTLILDPTDEFVWTNETCQKVYNEFQDLVDHYEGAELSEYTLRLIGSDLEHYIRKMLYDGEIKYNMRSRVLNFSMGKPRVKFNSSQIPDRADLMKRMAATHMPSSIRSSWSSIEMCTGYGPGWGVPYASVAMLHKTLAWGACVSGTRDVADPPLL